MLNVLEVGELRSPGDVRACACHELAQRMMRFEECLARLERRVDREVRVRQQWLTVADVSAELGKSEFTVREWCRLGRINARKCGERRGANLQWRIAAEEVDRYRRDGLLAENPARNR